MAQGGSHASETDEGHGGVMTLRPGLPPLPPRMRALPLDARGYPVPYFVEWIDGAPDFRVTDPAKWQACVKFARCWICGEPLGRWKVFVIGPKSAQHALSGEPPSHRDCAAFAVRACPFILLPTAKHRAVPAGAHVIETVDPHNPGTYGLWTTDAYTVVDGGKAGALLQMGTAREVRWFIKGVEQ